MYVCVFSLRTGSAEEYGEKETLLTELTEMYNEKGTTQEKTAAIGAKTHDLAIRMRADACKTLADMSHTPSGTKRARSSVGSFLEPICSYMENKAKAVSESEEKKLQLEKQKLDYQGQQHQQERELRWAELREAREEREARQRAHEEERKSQLEREKEE